MPFSLSQWFDNLGWLGRADAERNSKYNRDLADIAIDSASRANVALKKLDGRVQALEQEKDNLPWERYHRRTPMQLREDIDALRGDLEDLRADVNALLIEPLRTRVRELERLTSSLYATGEQREAQDQQLKHTLELVQQNAREQERRLARVAADAAQASRIAVREALEQLESEPSVVGAAFANAERFTELLATSIDRN